MLNKSELAKDGNSRGWLMYEPILGKVRGLAAATALRL